MLVKLEWREAAGLQNLAVFIGGNTSVCVNADEVFGCRRNCIYFTDDYPAGESQYFGGAGSDRGIYEYGEKRFDSLYPGTSRSRVWPPIWVIPYRAQNTEGRVPTCTLYERK